MEPKLFYNEIGLSAAAKAFVAEHPVDEAEYAAVRELFVRDRNAFFNRILAGDDPEGTFLRYYLKMALDCYPEYQKRDIPDDIFFDTFSDIALWEREYRNATGRPGVGEYSWLANHVSLELFRLWRLQFQPSALPVDVICPDRRFSAGTLVLKVHIPKGPFLFQGETADSYRRAESFFRGVPPLFVCESWLLCPELTHLLKEDSNILAFQRSFFLFGLEEESRQAEERIFGELRDDPARYPTGTSLQRAAREFLCAGGRLPSAWGIRWPGMKC